MPPCEPALPALEVAVGLCFANCVNTRRDGLERVFAGAIGKGRRDHDARRRAIRSSRRRWAIRSCRNSSCGSDRRAPNPARSRKQLAEVVVRAGRAPAQSLDLQRVVGRPSAGRNAIDRARRVLAVEPARRLILDQPISARGQTGELIPALRVRLATATTSPVDCTT